MGVLTQFDSSGAHVLGSGTLDAAVAFGPTGQVLEVVTTGGVLTQFDSSGAHVLFGSGVEGVGVAFGPTGQVLEIVSADAVEVPIAEPAMALLFCIVVPATELFMRVGREVLELGPTVW